MLRMRRGLADLGYAMTALLLMIGLYAAAYCTAVERQLRPGPACTNVVRPSYRWGGEAVFLAAYEIDRRVRPVYWTKESLYRDWFEEYMRQQGDTSEP